MRKALYTILFALFLTVSLSASAQNPKREFRGAWIQCVNNQFNGVGCDAMQQTLMHQLNELQQTGINAIMFQVRAEADALYQSSYEPWSRYLTGQQGRAPEPYWDPLQWMVEQCHLRGMELHAWINPYRAKTKGTTALANTHPYFQHPEWFISYDGLLLFDPGVPQNRTYICQVACDIVRRYDVDGLHIDDYFYPYPVAGVPIADDASYAQYGEGMNRQDWRRHNVNLFIRDLHDSIQAVKPWVKFSVSPFGIYRNQKSDPNGSATHGLQNYDDLYADVLLWVREGWIDLNIPQVYWEIGNKAADYDTLLRWWSRNATNRPLIIGQDVERTVKYPDTQNPQSHQIYQKYNLQRTLPGIQGSCQWYAKACVDNPQNYATVLRKYYHRTPALQPLMPWIDKKAPGKVKSLKPITIDGQRILFWTAPKVKGKGKGYARYVSEELNRAVSYVVYRFPKGVKVNVEDANYIYAITRNTFVSLPQSDGTEYTYAVAALDRLHNESKAVKKKIE
ncbi:MAG: family 10 glycosylhydrolase [Bacteroidales bacterium]|nr:family 10 glycosylhydrolase [Candidatus Physcousia equi]